MLIWIFLKNEDTRDRCGILPAVHVLCNWHMDAPLKCVLKIYVPCWKDACLSWELTEKIYIWRMPRVLNWKKSLRCFWYLSYDTLYLSYDLIMNFYVGLHFLLLYTLTLNATLNPSLFSSSYTGHIINIGPYLRIIEKFFPQLYCSLPSNALSLFHFPSFPLPIYHLFLWLLKEAISLCRKPSVLGGGGWNWTTIF